MPSSVCSTASQMSQMSVAFDGQSMSLEQAIDKGIGQLQGFLNGLQCQLRTLAMMDDLSEDPVEDFKEMIGYTDKVDDAIDDMDLLFGELKDVTRQILGPCPKDCKLWYKGHVTERKVAAAAEREQRKSAMAAAKEFNSGLAAISEQKS